MFKNVSMPDSMEETCIESCPICDSVNISSFQKIYLQRQKIFTPQYRCEDCESFFHRSGYTEDKDQLAADTRWFIEHREDAPDLSRFLRGKFRRRFWRPSCFEAGCGIGHLLKQFSDAGFKVCGIDPNSLAIEHGRRSFGLNMSVGYFTALKRPVDVLVCMDVMEHLEKPVSFAHDLVASVKPGGYLAVRVPMVRRDKWKFLPDAVSTEKAWDFNDPFLDNSVHITHFSPQGLVMMMDRQGATFDSWLNEIGIFKRQQPT